MRLSKFNNVPALHPERYSQQASIIWNTNEVIGATYSTYDGMSANTSNTVDAFTYFGYASPGNIDGYTSSSSPWFSGPANSGFTNTMESDILAYRPCIVSGHTGQTAQLGGIYYTIDGVGHAWVCDGLTYIYIQGRNIPIHITHNRAGVGCRMFK